MRATKALAILTALSIAAPALAQDDWELVQQNGATAATVAFDNGLAVIVRCQGESLETYVRGLSVPAVTENDNGVRTIDYAFGEAALRRSSWQISANGQSLFADVPATMARRFREGGALQMRLAAEGENPARRYVVGLPPSPSAINHVLGACGRAAVDPRDLLRASEASDETAETATLTAPSWRRQPRPRYSDAAVRAGVEGGMAVLSCITNQDGALDDCQVEVERPAGVGFGVYAIRAAGEARLTEETAARFADDPLVTFTVRYRGR